MYQKFIPSYKNLSNKDFESKIDTAYENFRQCSSCPNDCKVNRIDGETAVCFSSAEPIISSYDSHFGEEPLISGSNGAGNIFFGNCNLKCVYCQNYFISQNPDIERKNQISVEQLSEIIIQLQLRKCHNIGLVSPTHFSAPILHAIYLASQKGLNLPIIYNSNGYDSVETLKLFKDVIDIYLPDFKYGDSEIAKKYSKVNNYFEVAKAAISEMYQQVGSKLIIENNVVVRGLIVRHLILPNKLAETEKVFQFISELDKGITISLLSQYYPTNKTKEHYPLNRTITRSEYNQAINLLKEYKLTNCWVQEFFG